MRPLVGVSELLERRIYFILLWDGLGSGRQQQGVFPRQHQMGTERSELQQQTKQCESYSGWERVDVESSERTLQDRAINLTVSSSEGDLWQRPYKATRCTQPVYDILDCGPRQRFVVLGDCGPMIVHNCQSLAFAIMKWQAMNIHQRYPIAFNVHDEWVTTAPENEAQQAADFLTECMSQVPVWAQGCPIAAEAAFAQRYGDT
jgi:hypothetical protein